MPVKLWWGIHDGTLYSRDSGPAVEFENEQAARAEYLGMKPKYESIGYMFWFCKIILEDGAKIELESNPYH